MRVYRCLTAVLCFLLLAACSQRIEGTAQPAETTDTVGGGSTPNTPTEPADNTFPETDLRIPDPRSVDICSALDQDTVAALGETDVSSGIRFSECIVTIAECLPDEDPDELSDEEKADLPEEQQECLEQATDAVSGSIDIGLTLQDLSEADEEPRLVTPANQDPTPISELTEFDVRGHPALQFPESERGCSYALPLANEAMVIAYVGPNNESDADDENNLCEIGDDVLTTAVTAIADEELNEFDQSADSFAFQDLCSRLDRDDVMLDGVDWSQHVATDFGRVCNYVADDEVGLRIALAPQLLPDTEHTPAEGPEELADRPTWRIPRTDGDDDATQSCKVSTTRADDPPEESEQQAEMATVRVVTPPDSDADELDHCAAAESVAKQVWPKLEDS